MEIKGQNTLSLYKSFMDIVKELKIGKSFSKSTIKRISEINQSQNQIIEHWKDILLLVGFELNSYIETIEKNYGEASLNLQLSYNIYLFTIVKILVEYLLKEKGVIDVEKWVEAQIFTPLLIFKDQHTHELILNKFGNLKDLDKLVNTFDVLKILFEGIFPAKIRKSLGEFYTSDWLVNLILRNIDLKHKEVVDPSCGSGTILVNILRLRLMDNDINSNDNIYGCLDSIIGFDISPIAVQIARFNLLLTLAEYLNQLRSPIIMPIFFADSLYNPFTTTNSASFQEENVNPQFMYFKRLDLSLKIPKPSLSSDLHSFHLCQLLRRTIWNVQSDLYEEFIIGNMIAYKFTKRDVAIGNPPWLAWDGINRLYRSLLAEQWSFLFTQKGWRAKITAGRIDLSAICVYSSQMNFVKPSSSSSLIFILPVSLFKSKSAAEGFRKFKSQEGVFRPQMVWDFTSLTIFPNTSNKAVVAFFSLDKSLKYPIPWLKFDSKKKKIPTHYTLEQFCKEVKKEELISFPVSKDQISSPWVSIRTEGVQLIKMLEGKSFYRARGGINTGGANTIFWVEILETGDSLVKIRNVGKSIRAENKIEEGFVEKNLLYPLIRGRDIGRWYYKHELGILVPYSPLEDPKKAIPEDKLALVYPRSYEFLKKFQIKLVNRKEYIRWQCKGPFYELYRIGPYTFAPYKVMWQHTGLNQEMKCCVLSYLPEKCLMDQKVIIVPLEEEVEAHYFCALLNSEPAFVFLKSYLLLDASTHILEHLYIPKFNPVDKLHVKLAVLSKKCHELAKKKNDTRLIEMQINEAAREIWGLKNF